MVSWITSFAAWFQMILTLLVVVGGFVSYRQPEYHNSRTRIALIALIFLALCELFLILAQTYAIIPTRPLSSTLLSTTFGFVMFIYVSEFLFRRLRGRGWNIARICILMFYIALTIIIGIGYVHNL